jgi:uncharacterized protein DUF1508
VNFVVYSDGSGQYRWRLLATNGHTIASSGESFTSKASARRRRRASRPAPAKRRSRGLRAPAAKLGQSALGGGAARSELTTADPR